jgi:hypothetical protein
MEFDRGEPDAANDFQAANAQLIASSHLRLLRRPLLPDGEDGGDTAKRLYHAPFVVLAHDAAPDPVFFYANLAAQKLFELSWWDMVRLPSRHSAEPLAREERRRLLDRVARQGYIDDYAGVRIASSGRRFRIDGATVWNLLDDDGRNVGQAAAFADWIALG